MSNPFFRYPKFWTEALNFLPLLAFCLYALSFSETAGVEAAVIRVFVVYGLFLTYPTKKLVFAENAHRGHLAGLVGLYPRVVPLPAVFAVLHRLLWLCPGRSGPARRRWTGLTLKKGLP